MDRRVAELSWISRAGQFRGSIAYQTMVTFVPISHVVLSSRISDPFRKPQRKKCYVRTRGWSSSSSSSSSYFSSFSLYHPSQWILLWSLLGAAQILRLEITSFHQPRISSVNLSTDRVEREWCVYCVPLRWSRTRSIGAHVLLYDERIHELDVERLRSMWYEPYNTGIHR